MSDPISVAGSAVGVISLGIQVCQGLISYYSAWKACPSAIERDTSAIEELLDSLSVFKEILQKLSSSNSRSLARASLSVRSSEWAIKDLNTQLQKFQDTQPSGSASEKLKAVAKRSLYPFKQSTIDGLKAAAMALQSNLQTVLQAVQMDMLIEMQQTMSLCHTFSSASASTAENSNAALQAMQGHVNLLPAVQQQLISVESQSTATNISLGGIARTGTESRVEILRLGSVVEAGMGRIPQLDQSLQKRLDKYEQRLAEQNEEIKRFRVGVLNSPSLLKSVCDDISGNSSARRRRARTCRCTAKSRLPRGNVHAKSIYRMSSSHEKWCPLWVPRESTQEFGINISWLSRAIHVSISVTSGAGGLAISPLLRIRGIARENSPAFRLLEDLPVRFDPDNPQVEESHIAYLMSLPQKIEKLFDQGLASPAEINYRGRTLLHEFLSPTLFHFGELLLGPGSYNVISQLVSLGVPINEVDLYGFSALDVPIALAHSFTNTAYTCAENTITNILFGAGAETTASASLSSPHMLGNLDIAMDLADNYECGLLSKAAISRSEDDLSRCLSFDIPPVNERNKCGQTPLHFCAAWPPGIRLLLGAGADPNLFDKNGKLPIHYAIMKDTLESLALLCDGNSAIPSACFRQFQSVEAKKILLQALVNRREQLHHLASEHLPVKLLAEITFMDSRIPDACAKSVQAALEKRRVEIPKSISLSVWNEPVFHTELNAETAEAFYRAGFRNIDATDSMGLSPLMTHTPWSFGLITWLVNNGANLAQIDDNGKHLASHYVAACSMEVLYDKFGDLTRGYSQNKSRLSMESFERDSPGLIYRLLSEDGQDACSCRCSERGCSALAIMLKNEFAIAGRWPYIFLLREYSGAVKKGKLLRHFFSIFGRGEELWSRLAPTLIRYETFEKLELTHTCCEYNYNDFCSLEARDSEDVLEIQEEEHDLYDALEQLVDEFVTKFHEQGIPLVEFMNGFWTERMEEYLESKEAPDLEELGRIRELGVVIDS